MKPHAKILVASSNTAVVRGHRVLIALKLAGIPRQFQHRPLDGGSPAWTCPTAGLGDLDAAFQTMGGWTSVEQPDLFGDAAW